MLLGVCWFMDGEGEVTTGCDGGVDFGSGGFTVAAVEVEVGFIREPELPVEEVGDFMRRIKSERIAETNSIKICIFLFVSEYLKYIVPLPAEPANRKPWYDLIAAGLCVGQGVPGVV